MRFLQHAFSFQTVKFILDMCKRDQSRFEKVWLRLGCDCVKFCFKRGDRAQGVSEDFLVSFQKCIDSSTEASRSCRHLRYFPPVQSNDCQPISTHQIRSRSYCNEELQIWVLLLPVRHVHCEGALDRNLFSSVRLQNNGGGSKS